MKLHGRFVHTINRQEAIIKHLNSLRLYLQYYTVHRCRPEKRTKHFAEWQHRRPRRVYEAHPDHPAY
jgi:hypothetical protein